MYMDSQHLQNDLFTEHILPWDPYILRADEYANEKISWYKEMAYFLNSQQAAW